MFDRTQLNALPERVREILCRAPSEGGQGGYYRAPSVWKNPFVVGAVAIFVMLAVAASPFLWYTQHEVAFPGGKDTVQITVPAGSSGRTVAKSLVATGIGVSEDTLVAAMRFEGSPVIHAGSYEFERGMTLSDIVFRLTSGAVVTGSVRIADGSTFRQVLAALRGNGHLKVVTESMSEEQILAAIGASEKSAEGLFAPDTYKFNSGSTDLSLLKHAYVRQKAILSRAWESRPPKLKLKNPYEALILASLIEKESGSSADRALVSSVFHNRLRIWMPLQTDPTLIYGLGEQFSGRLHKRDLQRPGPYNTYLNYGLPPTPIAMPSAEAIRAALNPPDTKYLYFVARGDGTTHFSRGLVEHNRAVDKYQKGKK